MLVALLLGLTVIGIFLLGACTVVYLIVKALGRLFGTGGPSPARVQPRLAPRLLTREEELGLVRRDVKLAFLEGRITAGTRDEMLEYVEGALARLPDRKQAPVPATAAAGVSPLSYKEGPEGVAVPPRAEAEEGSVVARPEAARMVVPIEPTTKDAAQIRAAIAKLHTDAQAPAPAETTTERQRPQPPAQTVPAVVITPPPPPKPGKSLAERLFTPENVRILQSLGIGLIFISATAFVRSQVWEGATAWVRLALLLLGTFACIGIGFALRRWTALRITGLGFLILGHLSLIVDTCAALIPAAAGAAPLYPFAPESLWTFALLAFAASSFWHARSLKEPLFDAFTVFGGVAAWGTAAWWAGCGEWLLPAAFVPALFLARFGAGLHSAEEAPSPTPRWNLRWWLEGTWEFGLPLLAVAVPGAAVWSGTEMLRADYGYHAAALAALAAGFFLDAWQKGSASKAQAAAALLLLPVPLAAHAFGWAWCDWQVAFALPGTVMVCVALGIARALDQKDARREKLLTPLAQWGLAAVSAGALWAGVAWACEPLSAGVAAWSAGMLLATGLAFALVEGSATGVWLATLGAAFFSGTLVDLSGTGAEWLPTVWLGLALAGCAAWALTGRSGHALTQHGKAAADVLAWSAAVLLAGFLIYRPWPFWFAFLLYGPIQPGFEAARFAGWAALAAYPLLTSLWVRGAWRRGLGVALLGPALAAGFYWAGASFTAPAPWLAGLALLALAGSEWLDRREQDARRYSAGVAGVAVLLLQGILLAVYECWARDWPSAAVAFVSLALAAAVLSVRLRRGAWGTWARHTADTAALGLLAAAASCVAAQHRLSAEAWLGLLPIFSAGTLLVAMLGENLSRKEDSSDPVFRTGGEIVALALSALSLALAFVHHRELGGSSGMLAACWPAALTPLFLALRPRLGVNANTLRPTDISASAASGAVLASLATMLSGGLALACGFWRPGLDPCVYLDCSVFFGMALAVSALMGVALSNPVAPLVGSLAALGLLGCARGAWGWQAESFGLPCAALAFLALTLGRWLRQAGTDARCTQGTVLAWSGAGVGFFAAVYLLCGLAVWKAGATQAFPVAAWAVLAAAAWQASGGEKWRRVAAFLAGAAGLALGASALQWARISGEWFGPGLAGIALVLLALREVAAFFEAEEGVEPRFLRGRAGGLFWAALLGGVAALPIGLWGWADGHLWAWCATAVEEAALLGAVTVLARRHNARAPAGLLLVVELAMWFGLALAVHAAAHAVNFPLHGAGWALAGALFLLLGMAGESLAGAVVGPGAQARAPGAFLESRHVAALALGAWGLLTALCANHPFGQPAVDGLWRACFAAAALATYGSLARWSVREEWTERLRLASAFASYVVLIPAGYLFLLMAHATGSSWGALWFLVLAPALLAVAWVLENQKLSAQAVLARTGAAWVSGAALVMAFATNHERLAAVPGVTLLALALEALWVRAWNGRREWTAAALCALTGAAFFFLRAGAGYAAWGDPEPWVWELPGLMAFALGLLVAGGAFRLEAGTDGRSLVARCGAGLCAAIVVVMTGSLLLRGAAVRSLGAENMLRLDALALCLLLEAGACLAAWHWLKSEAGRYLALLSLLGAYALFVWARHGVAWEWYTVPAGLMCFVWAWLYERSLEEAGPQPGARQTAGTLLGAGSLLMLAPSFVQACPHTDASMTHYFVLVALSLLMVLGAMWTRRKVPLLTASSLLLLGTVVKAAEWAHRHQIIWPVAGIGIGFAVLAVGCLFESRMNRALRTAVDHARAQARMFWVTWE